VHTDLTITGKVAQFGRGVLAEVSGKLIGQFVRALEEDVLVGDRPSGGEPASSGGRPAPTLTPVAAEPVDLVATAGSSVVKRAVPLAVLLALVLWLVRRR
jgi:hypothetical protein